MGKVYFIGAGPGDPELITIKGMNKVKEAGMIIYAGSLVNPDILQYNDNDAEVYNSASMTLEEVIAKLIEGTEKYEVVTRVHTGDPSIYGAIREQMDLLDEYNIEYEVIPGVSSFVASAAAINKEFTLPGVSQTVICTRIEGRTSVPEKEKLELLASHEASMAIFLSVHMIEEVVEALMKKYSPNTRIAVIQRATWEDQKIVIGTLSNIAEKVKDANINKTAQILVGDFLGDEYELSKLYDKNFSHEYRRMVR